MGAWSQDRKGEDEGKLWVGGVRGGVRAGKEKMRENCGWVELRGGARTGEWKVGM